MPKETAKPPSRDSKSRAIFRDSPEEYKKLIVEILKEERGVQHLQRRSDIHSKIYDNIRRLIK
jgi:hypothetical protein